MNELVETNAAVEAFEPSSLLMVAAKRGASMEELERFMALHERWETKQAEKAYNVAFSDFKAEAVHIIKNRTVTDGPLRGKGYAELFAIVNAVTPALSKHKLHASWKVTKDDKDWLEVTCTIKHVGGHCESVSMGGPPDAGGAKNAIQARASTISYLERYTLKAATGLAEQYDDDDGNGSGPSEAENELIAAGRAESMSGMKPLTAWWGSLTAKQRADLNHVFPSLRRAAQAADKDGHE